MRIGILGGTFDPIHRAHLRAAAAALDCGLDRIVLVPARYPPHKDHAGITDPFHRFAMVALASSSDRRLGVSPCEVSREGISYTIDTVRQFISGGHEVTLIMGTDSLVEMETWKECRRLLDLASVIAYPRPPLVVPDIAKRLPAWIRDQVVHTKEEWARTGSILCVEGETDDTSSTRIRELIRTGQPVNGLMPAAVEEYIEKHGLYQ